MNVHPVRLVARCACGVTATDIRQPCPRCHSRNWFGFVLPRESNTQGRPIITEHCPVWWKAITALVRELDLAGADFTRLIFWTRAVKK